jgi:hypothetical protein
MIGLELFGEDAGWPLAGCAVDGAVAIDKAIPLDDGSGASDVAQQDTAVQRQPGGHASADIGVLFLQTMQEYTTAFLRQLQKG